MKSLQEDRPTRLYISVASKAIEFAFTNVRGKYCALPAHSIKDGVDPRRVAFTSICPLDPDEVIASFPGAVRLHSKAANKLGFELLLCLRQANCRIVVAEDINAIEKSEGIQDVVASYPYVKRLRIAHHISDKKQVEFGDPLERFVGTERWPHFLTSQVEPSLPLMFLSDIRAS